MKRLTATLACAAILGAVMLFLRGSAGDNAAALRPPSGNKDIARPATEGFATLGEAALETPVSSPGPEAGVGKLAPPAQGGARLTAQENDGAHILNGTLSVLGPTGQTRTDADAELTLAVFREDSEHTSQSQQVPIRDGRFQVAIQDPASVTELEIEHVSFDGLNLLITEPLFYFELAGTIRVYGTQLDGATLEVLEFGTQASVQDITILYAERNQRDNVSHPGEAEDNRRIATGLQSPVHIDTVSTRLRGQVLVGAPGYAWRRVTLDLKPGKTSRVLLEQGSNLTVTCTGVTPLSNTVLRVRNGDKLGPILETQLHADGTKTYEGMPPGTLVVSAEIGNHWSSPCVLASTELELAGGQNAAVSLSLDAPPDQDSVSIKGNLHVAEEWETEGSLMVQFQLLDPPIGGFDRNQFENLSRAGRRSDGYLTYAFHMTDMQPGRYSIGPDEPNMHSAVLVPAGGHPSVEIEIPPPVELLVYLADRETREAIRSDELHWNVKRPSEGQGGSLSVAPYDPARQAHVVRAPLATVEFMLWTWTHQPYTGEVDLKAGVREHTIELDPATGVVVHMVDEQGEPVAIPRGWRFGLRSEAEGAGAMLESRDRNRLKGIVNQPGTYRFDVPDIPEFAPMPTQTVEIPAGVMLEVLVPRSPR